MLALLSGTQTADNDSNKSIEIYAKNFSPCLEFDKLGVFSELTKDEEDFLYSGFYGKVMNALQKVCENINPTGKLII